MPLLSSPSHTFAMAGLQPALPRPEPITLPARLIASVSYPKGTVLGETVGTDEVQTVTLTTGGTLGGTYTLAFGGAVTGNIAFNATAAAVQTALEALATIGSSNVSVTGTTPTTSGGVLSVTFQNALGKRDVAALVADGANLTGTTPGVAIATGTAGAGRANEVQVIKSSGTVSGGTFTITYSGQTTAALAFNATAAQVKAALEALSNINDGDITVTGTAGNVYVVTFGGSLAATNVAAVTIGNGSITGGGSYVVATTVGGAAGNPGVYAAYSASGTDGRQVPRAVLVYDCSTDSSGNITYGLTAGASEFGDTPTTVPVFVAGAFRCEQLTGLTSAALVANPAWNLIRGTVANGIIRL